jgi:hypothetical protein
MRPIVHGHEQGGWFYVDEQCELHGPWDDKVSAALAADSDPGAIDLPMTFDRFAAEVGHPATTNTGLSLDVRLDAHNLDACITSDAYDMAREYAADLLLSLAKLSAQQGWDFEGLAIQALEGL